MIVAICTHNPRPAYLAETLGALRAQTQPVSDWRLLIIDNASREPLDQTLDLSWHPDARVVREEKLGTAHARHRALREARELKERLVLFVDDDNILANNYIARGLAIAAESPQLGAWGGQLQPRYETPPPEWLNNYKQYLAIWEFDQDREAGQLVSYDDIPPTAGCFIRAEVIEKYLQLVADEPRRLLLGARGSLQLRGEDTDLVLATFDLGLKTGRFTSLALTHIIPDGRLAPAYIANLMHGTLLGTAMLEYIRFKRIPKPSDGLLPRFLQLYRTARLPAHLRTIAFAELRAKREARKLVSDWQKHERRN